MTPCRECGRVNPPEATYCMTCATRLGNTQSREEPRWDDVSGGQSKSESYSTGPSTPEPEEEGRFEKLGPLLEDFAFDIVRAGAKLYFATRDPSVVEEARDRSARGGRRDRFERLKDAVAEARTEYRQRRYTGDTQDQKWR